MLASHNNRLLPISALPRGVPHGPGQDEELELLEQGALHAGHGGHAALLPHESVPARHVSVLQPLPIHQDPHGRRARRDQGR